MVDMARNWIIRQLSLGEFDSHRHVWRKAFIMACKIALFAYSLNFGAHLLMFQFDLLPYTLASGLIIATLMTPTIAFSVTLVVYVVLGFAIYDLGVSRAQLERLSHTDMLSGLANRRAFQQAFEQSKREKTMAVFDIDRFKSVNDTYGHTTGDAVIAMVAEKISSVFGDHGFCARIGGEEFAVLGIDMPFAEFAALAEIARNGIGTMPIEADGGTLTVTISCGVARAEREETFGETFSRADKALYLAKTGGRDRIVLSYEAEKPAAGQTGAGTLTV